MSVRILQGDALETLKTLPAKSVHCVVTSPPYWGLRDYGTAQWEGGEAGCDHAITMARPRPEIFGCTGWGERDGRPASGKHCSICGARRIDAQLGLEPTPEEHVAVMVAVFREVRRVLRKDGTLWLNYGDSYNAQQGAGFLAGEKSRAAELRKRPTRLKPKDLVGMPWRVAFALQADGWYLRQDIIWAKPNPMPESVRDRCTKAHEYLFLLAKSERYYFDQEAIAEPADRAGDIPGGSRKVGETPYPFHSPQHLSDAALIPVASTRNRRSVWTIATAPFSEAHFATFPPDLVEPCVKAGTSERGCCAECGKPLVRVIKTGALVGKDRGGNFAEREIDDLVKRNPGTPGLAYEKTTLGWSYSCKCNVGVIDNCTVLDPFAGAGTTGLVADRLGRNAILIELNPDYAAMARERIQRDGPLFAEVAAQ